MYFSRTLANTVELILISFRIASSVVKALVSISFAMGHVMSCISIVAEYCVVLMPTTGSLFILPRWMRKTIYGILTTG